MSLSLLAFYIVRIRMCKYWVWYKLSALAATCLLPTSLQFILHISRGKYKSLATKKSFRCLAEIERIIVKMSL